MGRAIRPESSAHLGPWPPKSRALQRWALIGVGVVAALVLMVLGRPPAPPGDSVAGPPAEAVGRWTTRAPRYAGRALVVGPSEVQLEMGDAGPPVQGFISEVRTWQEGSNTVVRLEYRTVDGAQILEMILQAPDRMRLRNPPEVVWTRSP